MTSTMSSDSSKDAPDLEQLKATTDYKQQQQQQQLLDNDSLISEFFTPLPNLQCIPLRQQEQRQEQQQEQQQYENISNYLQQADISSISSKTSSSKSISPSTTPTLLSTSNTPPFTSNVTSKDTKNNINGIANSKKLKSSNSSKEKTSNKRKREQQKQNNNNNNNNKQDKNNKRRRKNQDPRATAYKPPSIAPVCTFYLEGRCRRDNCEFRHEGTPKTKNTLCKFFLVDACSKTAELCPYSHDLSQFACKYHHRLGGCTQGDSCPFIHGDSSQLSVEQVRELDQRLEITRPSGGSGESEGSRTGINTQVNNKHDQSISGNNDNKSPLETDNETEEPENPFASNIFMKQEIQNKNENENENENENKENGPVT